MATIKAVKNQEGAEIVLSESSNWQIERKISSTSILCAREYMKYNILEPRRKIETLQLSSQLHTKLTSDYEFANSLIEYSGK